MTPTPEQSDTPLTDAAEAKGNRQRALLANYYVILEHARDLERKLMLADREQHRAQLAESAAAEMREAAAKWHEQAVERCADTYAGNTARMIHERSAVEIRALPLPDTTDVCSQGAGGNK